MNSSAAGKTFIKMQHQILSNDDCACFLVEAIAKKSQNIKWETTVDGQKVKHKLIRRVSLDQFYALGTGEENAFYKVCMALPEGIQKVVPSDTVMTELRNLSSQYQIEEPDLSIAMAVYMLGFSTYNGFSAHPLSR